MKNHWKYIQRDEKGRFTKASYTGVPIEYIWIMAIIFLIVLLIFKCTGGIPEVMTYKDLILKDGTLYCRECGEVLSANIDVRGTIEFGLRLEGTEVLMDEPDFQYEFSESLSDEFSCNNCGAKYTGAKELYSGNTELSEKEMEKLINSNKEK